MFNSLFEALVFSWCVLKDEEKERRKACRAMEEWAWQQEEEKEELRRQQEENERRIKELEDELFRLKHKR